MSTIFYAQDFRLKVVILEFLSVCVDAQPGLFEIFLNVQPIKSDPLGPSDSKAKKKVNNIHLL